MVLPFLVLVAIPVLAFVAIHRTVVMSALKLPSYYRTQKIVLRILTVVNKLGILGLSLVAIGLLDQERIGRPLGLVLPITLAGSAGARIAVPSTTIIPWPPSQAAGVPHSPKRLDLAAGIRWVHMNS